MSLLQQHFERIKILEDRGIPTTSALLVDVSGTLIQKNSPNMPLIEFYNWCREQELFQQFNIFTNDLKDSIGLFIESGLTPADLGLKDFANIRGKGSVYQEIYPLYRDYNIANKTELGDAWTTANLVDAYLPQLVIDDVTPRHDLFRTEQAAITHWNPYDKAVQTELKTKAYQAYTARP